MNTEYTAIVKQEGERKLDKYETLKMEIEKLKRDLDNVPHYIG